MVFGVLSLLQKTKNPALIHPNKSRGISILRNKRVVRRFLVPLPKPHPSRWRRNHLRWQRKAGHRHRLLLLWQALSRCCLRVCPARLSRQKASRPTEACRPTPFLKRCRKALVIALSTGTRAISKRRRSELPRGRRGWQRRSQSVTWVNKASFTWANFSFSRASMRFCKAAFSAKRPSTALTTSFCPLNISRRVFVMRNSSFNNSKCFFARYGLYPTNPRRNRAFRDKLEERRFHP
jgi:hypothetical protein